MLSVSGLLLGVINIAIVVAILGAGRRGRRLVLECYEWPVPWNVQRIYLAVVALIALYMVVALLLGFPAIHIIGTGPHAH